MSAAAGRPFVLVGGGGWSAAAKADLEALGDPEPVLFECAPGDVAFFHSTVIHRAADNRSDRDRRQIFFSYHDSRDGEHYLEHRKEVVRRRSEFELAEAEERAHILEGRLHALDHIEEVFPLKPTGGGRTLSTCALLPPPPLAESASELYTASTRPSTGAQGWGGRCQPWPKAEASHRIC